MSTTSRVGRKPVIVPSGVDVKIDAGEIAIKGPKGQLTLAIHPYIQLVFEDKKIIIKPNSEVGYCRSGSGRRLLNAVPGTIRSKINNAVLGVTKGFERKLALVGVGYRAQSKGKILNLTVGYSHPVDFAIPDGITIETPTLTEIIIKGIDKHLVGHTAAKIIDVRPPEPYKGKGIIGKAFVRKETKKK